MNKQIGEKIRERRKELDISAVEIAEMTGLSKATIHRYESGEIKNIKLPVIASIAKMLRVNPAWLIGKSSVKEIIDSDAEMKPVIDKIISQLDEKRMTYNGIQMTMTDMQILESFLKSYQLYLEELYRH